MLRCIKLGLISYQGLFLSDDGELEFVFMPMTACIYWEKIKQHMKVVEYQRTDNSIAKHVIETRHTINWHTTKWTETEKRTIPRKLLEGCYIRNNRNICMNLNDGTYASANQHKVPNTQFQPDRGDGRSPKYCC